MLEKDREKLIKITNETLKNLISYEIILPSLYQNVFENLCHKDGIECKNIVSNEKQLTLFKMQQYEQKTLKNVQVLEDNINEAKDAIDSQNSEKLIEIKLKMEELKAEIIRMKDELYHDDLTKVYNRKWFVENYLVNDKFNVDGSLAFIDLDNFKNINDTYGHVVGDKVLSFIALNLNKLKFIDTIRYAGDEFLLVSNKMDKNEMEKLLVGFKEDLSHKKIKVHNISFGVSFSIGVVNFKKSENFKDVLSKADKIMYKNKAK
ncbi:MAG: GGDEF domain-containing protein [Campylobacterales bacterium]|nr:GGDEF domain-containing protein [Campylobacterales bacterium]